MGIVKIEYLLPEREEVVSSMNQNTTPVFKWGIRKRSRTSTPRIDDDVKKLSSKKLYDAIVATVLNHFAFFC